MQAFYQPFIVRGFVGYVCSQVPGPAHLDVPWSQRFFLFTSREAARDKKPLSFSFSPLRDSCSPLRGSLTAVSCGEISRKTSGTRITLMRYQSPEKTPTYISPRRFQSRHIITNTTRVLYS